jgi:hypothetical protein
MHQLFKKLWCGLPLILIPLGIHSQQLYVQTSRGTGSGFVEIPMASASALIDKLISLRDTNRASVFITASLNPSLIKFQSSFLLGRQLLIAGKRSFFGLHEPVEIEKDRLSTQKFNLNPQGAIPFYNDFKEVTELQTTVSREKNAQLLIPTGNQTILNRSAYPENSKQQVLVMPWSAARNLLIFVHSDLGHSMITSNRLRTSLFPVFPQEFSNSSIAPVGRYLLFRVVNPTRRFRLLLNMSSTDYPLPPVSVVGSTKERLEMPGRGAARVVSPLMEPQWINGVPYICIDMGVDARRSPEFREGLMRLWGSNVPMDYKLLVGYARNISIVSEEEYQRFGAPSGIRKIPEDLLNQQLEYSGVYEDGWLSGRSYFIFSDPNERDPLTIRGMVPVSHDSAFRTTMSVIIDGQEIGRRTMGIGEFEYRFPVPPHPGRRRLELSFDKTQLLPYSDARQASALLRCVSFEVKNCGSTDTSDVITDGGGIWRGDNWYPLEKHAGQSLRWVNNNAEILVAPQPAGSELAIDLEPGASLHGEPLKLEALDATGQVLLRKDVAGRQTVRLPLDSKEDESSGLSTIRLHALNGGAAVAGDTRILNFRVFHVALQTATKPVITNDLVANDDVVQLGANWFPPESLASDHFRWVDNDAAISVSDPRVLAKGLTVELEPGPGIRKRPMVLRVLDSTGRQVQAMEISGRQTINIFPPTTTRKPAEYRLHVDNGGLKIATDPRILNFRVFKIYTAAHGAGSGGDVSEGPGLKIGKGWYPVESFTDGTFRWVNNDAEFTVDATHTRHLEVELQSGPGFDFKKMVLKLFDSAGRQVQAVEVNGRQTVKLLLPAAAGKEVSYRLHVDGGGKKISSDPRTLNFRVFKLKALD